MRNSKNASPGWPRAISRHCGARVTTSSCASKNCRTWEQENWICEKLASSPWKPPRMSDAASGGSPLRFGMLLRVVATVAALAMWFWTQSLIGSRAPSAGIGVLLLGMRQVMQALCALPAPPNMIWRYPGFPSLFVTYNVGNDYFFSGHTAIAVFGAIEVARLRQQWLTAFALTVVVFEVATVLILRAHYTMDVFAGAVTALWVAALCESVGPRVDHLLHETK